MLELGVKFDLGGFSLYLFLESLTAGVCADEKDDVSLLGCNDCFA